MLPKQILPAQAIEPRPTTALFAACIALAVLLAVAAPAAAHDHLVPSSDPQPHVAGVTRHGAGDVASRTECGTLNNEQLPYGLAGILPAIYQPVPLTGCVTATLSVSEPACHALGNGTYHCVYHYDYEIAGTGAGNWEAHWYPYGDTTTGCLRYQEMFWGAGYPKGGLNRVLVHCAQQEVVFTAPPGFDGCASVGNGAMSTAGNGRVAVGGTTPANKNAALRLDVFDLMVCPMICGYHLH